MSNKFEVPFPQPSKVANTLAAYLRRKADFGPYAPDCLDAHIDYHLFNHGALGTFGLPLYDLELANAVRWKLPLTEGAIVEDLTDGDYDNPATSIRAHSLLTGAYLGVFTTRSLGLLPPDFTANPYAKTLDISLVQDISRLQPAGHEVEPIPYPAGLITPRNLLEDSFEPLQIEIIDRTS